MLPIILATPSNVTCARLRNGVYWALSRLQAVHGPPDTMPYIGADKMAYSLYSGPRRHDSCSATHLPCAAHLLPPHTCYRRCAAYLRCACAVPCLIAVCLGGAAPHTCRARAPCLCAHDCPLPRAPLPWHQLYLRLTVPCPARPMMHMPVMMHVPAHAHDAHAWLYRRVGRTRPTPEWPPPRCRPL